MKRDTLDGAARPIREGRQQLLLVLAGLARPRRDRSDARGEPNRWIIWALRRRQAMTTAKR